MFRIVSPWLLLLYCLTSTLCSLCQTLPRPVRFFALCPSCSGHPLLMNSVTCSRVSPSIFISTVFCCFPIVIVFVFSTLIFNPNLWLPLCTSSVSSCSNQINVIRESQVVDCLSSYSGTRLC